MGISIGTAQTLIGNRRDRRLGESCLTLGKQDVSFTFADLMAAKRELEAGDAVEEERVYEEFRTNGRMHARGSEAARGRYLSDEFLLRFIGFKVAKSVDYSDYEGADFTFDLNNVGLAAVTGSYDVIFDGGTMEHVFHVPNVLRNIYEALNPGGTIIHHSPSNNMLDHGFYQFSPRFFWDYYHTNEYEDIDIFLTRGRAEHPVRAEVEAALKEALSRYVPGSLACVSDGGLDNAMYGTVLVARKGKRSTYDRVPRHGRSW